MSDAVFSTAVLASFLGGIVALLAPCCVSVMLPAYFASAFRSRTRLVAMTLVFAAGVGTVILPIGLGAAALTRLITGQHVWVFSIGGAAMVLGGVAMLAGWKPMLPMPAMRTGGGAGHGSVYALGVFSGAASSCCAPVLAGVVALSAASTAFVPAVVLGVAYVFGMVAPLAALALVWDRRDWGSSRLLAQRKVSFGRGRFRRVLPLSSLLSGGLLAAMGVLTIVLAVRGPAMPADGWQVRVSAWLDHQAALVERALSGLPGWLPAAAILLALAALVAIGVRGRRSRPKTPARVGPGVDPATSADSSRCTPPTKEIH